MIKLVVCAFILCFLLLVRTPYSKKAHQDISALFSGSSWLPHLLIVSRPCEMIGVSSCKFTLILNKKITYPRICQNALHQFTHGHHIYNTLALLLLGVPSTNKRLSYFSKISHSVQKMIGQKKKKKIHGQHKSQ